MELTIFFCCEQNFKKFNSKPGSKISELGLSLALIVPTLRLILLFLWSSTLALLHFINLFCLFFQILFFKIVNSVFYFFRSELVNQGVKMES
jgi:hypothetical protein